MRKHIVIAALLSATFTLPAVLATGATVSADSLKPMQGKSIDLGKFHGTAYYTAEQDGYHLTVTFAEMNGDETPAQPLRFETVLADQEAATISMPQGEGQKPMALTFRRVGDHVEMSNAPVNS